MKFKEWLFDKKLPIYVPRSARFTARLHLAVWNCGTRPQTFRQAWKDTRITVRKDGNPIFVIKKGSI